MRYSQRTLQQKQIKLRRMYDNNKRQGDRELEPDR